jgi:hypothetical protein
MIFDKMFLQNIAPPEGAVPVWCIQHWEFGG